MSEIVTSINVEHGFKWMKDSFSYTKYKRREIGFGEYINKQWTGGVMYIREQSIMRGGFGCALWDAAILLSRWIYSNNAIFTNKTVLELGSGVGLCGLMAARYSKSVYLTDYLDPILENLEYNKNVNSFIDDPDLSDDEIKWRENIGKSVNIVNLDWDNHGTTNIPLVDIIIGSELTYSDISVDGLVNTILTFLKEDGVFYEILSDNRDGVQNFIQKMKNVGFEVVITPIPEDILNPKIKSSQRPETYHFYTFRRKKCTYPNLG